MDHTWLHVGGLLARSDVLLLLHGHRLLIHHHWWLLLLLLLPRRSLDEAWLGYRGLEGSLCTQVALGDNRLSVHERLSHITSAVMFACFSLSAISIYR